MARSYPRIMALAVCLVAVSCSHDVSTKDPARDSKAPAGDAKALEGLWLGHWGGGSADGVHFLPVIAELIVQGDHVELHGFPEVGKLTGTVRIDASAKKIHITPKAEAGQPTPKPITYAYTIKADELTLNNSISFTKQGVAQNPLADAGVHLVAATGINDAGDLLVTEFTVLRVGQAGAAYFEPVNRLLKTKQATVLLVQETGCKKVTVDEARRLIRKSTPVAVAYRHEDRPYGSHELWKVMGPPQPDSEAVWQTFARTLRPGTLVFILSAHEKRRQQAP